MKRFYSIQDLADLYGSSVRTFANRIAKLKEQKLFSRTSISKSYDRSEAEKLSELLNFPLDATNGNTRQRAAS